LIIGFVIIQFVLVTLTAYVFLIAGINYSYYLGIFTGVFYFFIFFLKKKGLNITGHRAASTTIVAKNYSFFSEKHHVHENYIMERF
jgi:hypothetical protein